MAVFHRATIQPTKQELLATWAPTQPWGPPAEQPLHMIGSYRFDDPNGRVGMETHLFTVAGQLFHVPLTYRDEPLADGEAGLITQMSHSVLGNRWVYDGLHDPVFHVMLAGVAMTGQGEALGTVVYEGRFYLAPSSVRISGGGWGQERVPVDGFQLASDDAGTAVLRNDRFDVTFFRRPLPGARPPIGLTATWPGQEEPVVLAAVEDRA